MINEQFNIIKASGEEVEFNSDKLKSSLQRSGADQKTIKKIIDEVEGVLYNGMTTKEIYRKAFKLLRQISPHSTAARYKLKKAIFELGPTGFPFEKFVGAILSYEGFQTEMGVIVKGHCVNHEVDVIAQKDNKHFMIECKFHSDQGRFCNVKIPLYIQSRFKDVEVQWEKQPGHDTKFHQGWVVTNTRFTSDAIQYANCMGLMLMSWDYPKKGSLKERIDQAGLHPVTCLTSLTKYEKQQLLDKEIVLCMDLCNQPKLLNSIHISTKRQKNILREAHELCAN